MRDTGFSQCASACKNEMSTDESGKIGLGCHLGMNNKGFPGPQLLQGLAHQHADVRGVHPYQAIHRPCWVQQWPQHIQCGPYLELQALLVYAFTQWLAMLAAKL